MSSLTKTYTPKTSDIKRDWRVVDAAGRPLGRLASEVAQILKGKDKPCYTPHMDTGDFVIIVNASQVVVTGNKATQKIYYTHSMYPGGLKSIPFDQMIAKHPRRVVEWAVWGMLPKNRLGRALFRKLKVYAEGTHPHGAQAKDYAAQEKAGKPGIPRPPKKVRARREPSEVLSTTEPTVPLESVSTTDEPPPGPRDADTSTPAHEEVGAPLPVGETALELEPIVPEPRRPRSRKARAIADPGTAAELTNSPPGRIRTKKPSPARASGSKATQTKDTPEAVIKPTARGRTVKQPTSETSATEAKPKSPSRTAKQPTGETSTTQAKPKSRSRTAKQPIADSRLKREED